MSPDQESKPAPEAAERWHFWLHRVVPLAALVALLVAAYATGWHRELSFEALVRHNAAIDEFIAAHRVAAVLLFAAIYAISAALAMPVGPWLAVIGGFLFGTLVGGAASLIGSVTAATTVFAIARSAFGEHLARRAGPLAERLAEGFRADAFCYVLSLRLMPVPSWVTNLTAALCNVRPATFVTATALGRTPGSFVFALFGAGLDSVIAAEEAAYRACLNAGGLDCQIGFDPATLLTPTLVAGLIALGLLALVPVVARRLLWRRTEPGRS